jgi:hypothetical protein
MGITTDRIAAAINDRAFSAPAQQQIIALPYDDRVLEAPMLLLARRDLAQPVGSLTADEQDSMDCALRLTFGLA